MRLPFPATLAAASQDQEEQPKRGKGRKRSTTVKPDPPGVRSHADLISEFRAIMRENVANIERASQVSC
jgi:hypothetical protein